MTQTSDIVLRPATSDDLEPILAACKETFDRHFKALPFAFHADSFEAFYARYITVCIDAQTRDETAGLVEIAMVDGKLAGYVILAESRSSGGGLEVFDIHVYPDFRKMGVGEALLEWCKRRAGEFNAHNLDATVWALGDERHAFFEKSGFTKVNEIWRIGSINPPQRSEPPRRARDWGVLNEPNFLWGIIAVLSVLLVLR